LFPLSSSEKARQSAHINGEHEAETQRNQDRIKEIMHLRSYFGEELDTLELDIQPSMEFDD